MEKSEKIATISILINLSLLAIKYGFSILSGSAGLKADAIHSSSDVAASLIVLAGLNISKRKSKRFPYGLYKVENFVSLIVAIAILFAGYEIAKESLFGGSESELKRIPFAILATIAVIITTLIFSRYEAKKGAEIGSPSLIADGKHVLTDMWSSIAVLLGLIGNLFGINLDRVSVFVVILFIAHAGIMIFIDAMRVLLDASIDFETLDRVKKTILSEHTVKEIHSLTGRNSGRYKFIEAEVVLNVRELEKAQSIGEKIEKSIKNEINNVDHVLIHYEPIQKESISFAVPLDDKDGKVSKHFGEAPYFAIITVSAKDKIFKSRVILPNPFLSEERGKGILVSEFIIKQGIDVLLLKEKFEGRGPEYVLSDSNIEVIITDADNLKDVLTQQGVT